MQRSMDGQVGNTKTRTRTMAHKNGLPMRIIQKLPIRDVLGSSDTRSCIRPSLNRRLILIRSGLAAIATDRFIQLVTARILMLDLENFSSDRRSAGKFRRNFPTGVRLAIPATGAGLAA